MALEQNHFVERDWIYLRQFEEYFRGLFHLQVHQIGRQFESLKYRLISAHGITTLNYL